MRLGGNIRSSFGEWRAIIARPETARSLSRRQATVPPRLSREAGGSSLLQSWSRPQCRGPLGGACSAAIARPIRIHTSCPSWSPRPSLRSACRAASISASARTVGSAGSRPARRHDRKCRVISACPALHSRALAPVELTLRFMPSERPLVLHRIQQTECLTLFDQASQARSAEPVGFGFGVWPIDPAGNSLPPRRRGSAAPA
jgi:hypothetical protein